MDVFETTAGLVLGVGGLLMVILVVYGIIWDGLLSGVIDNIRSKGYDQGWKDHELYLKNDNSRKH